MLNGYSPAGSFRPAVILIGGNHALASMRTLLADHIDAAGDILEVFGSRDFCNQLSYVGEAGWTNSRIVQRSGGASYSQALAEMLVCDPVHIAIENPHLCDDTVRLLRYMSRGSTLASIMIFVPTASRDEFHKITEELLAVLSIDRSLAHEQFIQDASEAFTFSDAA